MRAPVVTFVFSLALVALSSVTATGAGDAADWVEATGNAKVVGGDVEAARNKARLSALKICIEIVVGVTIKSEFSSEQREVVADNRNDFYANVSESLMSRSEGFVDTYEILSEELEGDTVELRVRARVFESKVKVELAQLADLLVSAGNPKLMIVIKDYLASGDVGPKVQSSSALGAYLERELLARGFELRGQAGADATVPTERDAYDSWLEDAEGIAALARDYGADILIAGIVNVKNLGEIKSTGGIQALKGQTRIEVNSHVRGINAASAEVIASKPVTQTSIGLNLDRALGRVFKGRGKNLVKRTVDALIDDLKRSFRRTANQGAAFVVSLSGVKSFRRQAKRFMTIVGKLQGVSTVGQQAYADGELALKVACKCTAAELQDRIFSAVETTPALATLDIVEAAGKRLSFSLTP